MIVSYNVRIIKVDDEKFTVINCITAKEFDENQKKYYMRLTGTYKVEVQAIPLYAEPGQWTKYVTVSWPYVINVCFPLLTAVNVWNPNFFVQISDTFV